MKQGAWAVIALVGVLVFAGITLPDENENQRLRELLGADKFTTCGIEKLSDDEQESLAEVMVAQPLPFYIEEAAVRYLEKQGWQKVRIIGAVETDGPFEELHLLAVNRYEFFTLDPVMSSPLADPGIYWCKITGTSWTLLYPDGAEGTFWSDEL